MARARKSCIWTICYALSGEGFATDEPFTATWFAYGRSAEEAADKFLRDFRGHPEDFYGATEETQIAICNVVKGFSA